MIDNPYILDILDQPFSLRRALDAYQQDLLSPIGRMLHQKQFDQIIMTGLGSSSNGTYPAYLKLCQLSIPVKHWTTAEILHFGGSQITQNALLWVSSQSGCSAEIAHLVADFEGIRPACVLALTNNTASILGQAADVVVDMKAGPEFSVATKTYIHTLAYASLMAVQLIQEDIHAALADWYTACDLMEEYLGNWAHHVQSMDQVLGDLTNAVLVGRGPSMAGVWNGSLNQKEAAHHIIEGINSAEFRHGPLELAGEGFTLIVFEGSAATSSMNLGLAQEVVQAGGKAVWIGMNPPADLPALCIPNAPGIALPAMEILPMQLLTLVLAERKGMLPGHFRNISKVVLVE